MAQVCVYECTADKKSLLCYLDIGDEKETVIDQEALEEYIIN